MDVDTGRRNHQTLAHSIQSTPTDALPKPNATSARAAPEAQRAPAYVKPTGIGAARGVVRPSTSHTSKVLSALEVEDSVTEDDSQPRVPMDEDSLTEDDSQAPEPEQDSEFSDPQPPKKKTKTQTQPDVKGKAAVKTITVEPKVIAKAKQKIAINPKATKKGKKVKEESSDVEIVDDMGPPRKKKSAAKKIVAKGIFPTASVDLSDSHQKDKMNTESSGDSRYVSFPFGEPKLICNQHNLHVPLHARSNHALLLEPQ